MRRNFMKETKGEMLERARHMLLSEVSMARGVPEIHAAAMLQRALTKAGLTLMAASDSWWAFS